MLLACFTRGAVAQLKTCPRLSVLTLINETQAPSGSPLVSAPLDIQVMPGTAAHTRRIVVTGPILGSMDARDLEITLHCTRTGVSLSMTSIRSADFHGSVLKDDPWRARITLELGAVRRDATFKAVWAMNLTTGQPVTTPNPSQPERRFPLTASAALQ